MLKRLIICFMGRKINRNKVKKNEGSEKERKTKRIRKPIERDGSIHKRKFVN